MAVGATNAASTIGLNFAATGANGLGATLTLGGIDFNKTNTTGLTIGNNSGTNGILQVNGATINSVGKTLVRVAGSADFTIAPNISGSNTMGLRLGITDGIFDIASGRTLTISSIISELSTNSGFTKTGTGTLTLATNNTFTGKTVINAGFVAGSGESMFGANPASNVADQITLNGGGIRSTGSVNFSSNRGLTLGASGGTFDTTGGTITLTNVVAGTAGGSFTKVGTGILIAAGVHTYDGATSIQQGTLQLTTGNDRLPTGTVVALGQASSANLGTLDLNSRSQQIAGLNSTTGSNATPTNNTVTSGGTATLTIGGSGTYSYGDGTNANSGIITGAISLVKSGSGTQTLGDTNTYTGGTTISGGTLNVTNGSGSATGTGALTLDSTGTLSGTGIIAPAINTNINLNGSLIVGDTTLGSPVASSITLTTSGSGVTTTSTSSLFHFDLFTRIGGANPLGSADYIKLPGTLNNNSMGPNLGTIVITNRIGPTTFALGDSWHLFDFTGGGTITDDFNVDYTNLGLSGDLIGQFDRLSGTFSIVPEPSRTLFLTLGLLTLTLRRRR